MRALPSYLNPSIKTLLKSLRSLILAMAAQPREKALVSDDPPFDPSKPAVPISYPIKKLDDLLSRSYFDSFHFPFNKASTPLPLSSSSLTSGPRILVCHDMEGGYVDDKWVQGGTNSDAYAIWHWYLIDVFVYFSHNLVTIPPPCWTNAAHTHGVKVLGTFITEWDEGKAVCDILLSTKENAHLYAERLSELAVALGFDGWLMNMEVDLDSTQIPNLKEFVSHLTKIMHSSAPGSLVIWYDSVTKDGNLSWQNQLNEYNKPFFDICDGIFVNYSWEEDYPKLSASVAGERKFDVYMGIDVFGRGTYGGGQWTTNVALDVLKKDEVSAAIFAPGWVYETKQPPDFQTAQNRWWGLVEKSWGIVQNYPKLLPFFSNFDQGRGLHISSEGLQVSSDRWNNISCQTFQPVFDALSDPAQSSIRASVNFKDGSYSGGVCISFKGTVKDNSSVAIRLFKGDLPLGDLPVHITYSVNLDGNALLGLSLGFSKATERVSIFLAPRGRTFPPAKHITNKFSKVITPLLVTNSGGEALEATGWTLQQTSIKMKDYSLTDVNAVCYKEHSADLGSELSKLDIKPDSKSTLIIGGTSDFSASLGHISIRTSGQNMEFPPAASWEVTAQFITWGASSQGAKTVSLKINWKLKEGPDESSLFLQYNIYVRTSATRVATATPSNAIGVGEKYLGVAKVGSFYVSDLLIPTKVSNLLFIIQVCGLDGGSQKLDHSPTFQLAVTASSRDGCKLVDLWGTLPTAPNRFHMEASEGRRPNLKKVAQGFHSRWKGDMSVNVELCHGQS